MFVWVDKHVRPRGVTDGLGSQHVCYSTWKRLYVLDDQQGCLPMTEARSTRSSHLRPAPPGIISTPSFATSIISISAFRGLPSLTRMSALRASSRLARRLPKNSRGYASAVDFKVRRLSLLDELSLTPVAHRSPRHPTASDLLLWTTLLLLARSALSLKLGRGTRRRLVSLTSSRTLPSRCVCFR
jgi:hypothetical protein